MTKFLKGALTGLRPSARQLAEYTQGQVLPPLREAVFLPGKRGRPKPGAGRITLQSLDDVRQFLTTGQWWE
ncbi:MAG TPA: hypothetical protein VLH09_14385, partial [Bryobacteraceae bacterium]|nr:hypothetical protein [Bryobacteraceae bacterium]